MNLIVQQHVKFKEIVHLYDVGHVHNVCHLLTASRTIRIKWEVKAYWTKKLVTLFSTIFFLEIFSFTLTFRELLSRCAENSMLIYTDSRRFLKLIILNTNFKVFVTLEE